MCIEEFFGNYNNTIAFLGALGTLVVACVAVWMPYKNSKELSRIRLSGLSVKEIDDNGVLYLQNNTDIDLNITISINKDVINEHEKNGNYQEICLSRKWRNLNYDVLKENIILSKGETLPIHLKSFAIERVYIALVALKIQFAEKHKSELGKTKIYLLRYAGDLAKDDKELGEISHPHNKWLIECTETQ